MKMDLKEEQNREKCLMKEKRSTSSKITEILPTINRNDTEKLEFAEKYDECGQMEVNNTFHVCY